MPHYAYRVHNEPGQILSQVPEDINKTLKEDTFKQSAGSKSLTAVGCKKPKVSTGSKSLTAVGCTKKGSKCSTKGTKATKSNKITSLDELRMKYSK